MESNSRIVLTRSSEWMNRARRLRVYINGEKAGTIGNANTEEFKVQPGQHSVSCKVDWCSSRDFEVHLEAEQTVYLQVRSGMKHYWYFAVPLLGVLAINLFYLFTQPSRPVWLDFLLPAMALPLLLYIFYFISIGRKDYLVISNDDKTLFGK